MTHHLGFFISTWERNHVESPYNLPICPLSEHCGKPPRISRFLSLIFHHFSSFPHGKTRHRMCRCHGTLSSRPRLSPSPRPVTVLVEKVQGWSLWQFFSELEVRDHLPQEFEWWVDIVLFDYPRVKPVKSGDSIKLLIVEDLPPPLSSWVYPHKTPSIHRIQWYGATVSTKICQEYESEWINLQGVIKNHKNMMWTDVTYMTLGW